MIKFITVLLSILILVFVFNQVNSPTELETKTTPPLNSDSQDQARENAPGFGFNEAENLTASETDFNPEIQTISLDGQNHTGLFLNGFTSLESKFLYLESTARDNPENAFLTAEMLMRCRIHSMPIEEIDEILAASYGSQFHLDMIAISQECQRIVDTSLFARWELYEMAARGGVEEAIIKQWDYPPSNSGSGELTISHDEWRETSLQRITNLAATGNVNAMIRLAWEYATKSSEYYDPDTALDYIDQIMANRDQLSPSQEYEAKFIYDHIKLSDS